MFELQAEFCRTMGNPTRLMILYALREGERCVNDLREMIDVSQPTISGHLASLRTLGIVHTRRRGQFVYYRLADPTISSACDMIRAILQRNMQARSDLFTGGGSSEPDGDR